VGNAAFYVEVDAEEGIGIQFGNRKYSLKRWKGQ